ncbi:MAG TPA: cupin domain-containing protein [Acidimicrobiales bacterium]|nr:cupin domain-containing protein [Acidimicrobiales bacterium]
MGATRNIPTGEAFDLTEEAVGLERSSGRAWFMEWGSGGPPPRIDGYTVGAPLLIPGGEPPHAGEMHPDADELLFLVSGRIRLRLELEGGHRHVAVGPGQAVVVPKGVWHLISIEEQGQLIHITPGPGGEHRPLPGHSE